jgi:hypothetical protein
VLNFVKLCGGKLTSVLYIPVCIATKTSINHKALSVAEKPEFIKKVDAQTHGDGWKGCGTTDMPVSAQNNIIMDQKSVLEQCNYSAQ